MTSKCIYDEFMKGVVERINDYDIDTFTKFLMTKIKTAEINQIDGNFYKYKSFHILELSTSVGLDYSNKLKILAKLNLTITQRYIETIEKENRVYIITQIPGTEDANLIPLWKFGKKNLTKENKVLAYRELQKLTAGGYVDDKVLSTESMWYVNSEHKIVIPTFANLRLLTSEDNSNKIMQLYYNLLFN